MSYWVSSVRTQLSLCDRDSCLFVNGYGAICNNFYTFLLHSFNFWYNLHSFKPMYILHISALNKLHWWSHWQNICPEKLVEQEAPKCGKKPGPHFPGSQTSLVNGRSYVKPSPRLWLKLLLLFHQWAATSTYTHCTCRSNILFNQSQFYLSKSYFYRITGLIVWCPFRR